MAELNFSGGSMTYKSIDEQIVEMKDSLNTLSMKFKVVGELNLQTLLHELMENYVAMKKPPYPEYKGEFRNEFIVMATKALNKLYDTQTFQNEYKVKYEVKP